LPRALPRAICRLDFDLEFHFFLIRKSEEAFTRIERFCPGPRVELFARVAREGWDTWGDQVGMFNEPVVTRADDVLITGPTGPTRGE
jgi:MT-A70